MNEFHGGSFSEPASAPVLGPAVPSHDRPAGNGDGGLQEPLAPFFHGHLEPTVPAAEPEPAGLDAAPAPDLQTYEELPWMLPEQGGPEADPDAASPVPAAAWEDTSPEPDYRGGVPTLSLDQEVVPIEALAPDDDDADVVPITALAPDEEPAFEPAPPEAHLEDEAPQWGDAAELLTEPAPVAEAALEDEQDEAAEAEPELAVELEMEGGFGFGTMAPQLEDEAEETELEPIGGWGDGLPEISPEPEPLPATLSTEPEQPSEPSPEPAAELPAPDLPGATTATHATSATDSALDELADRLEQIARSLRGRSPGDVFRNTGDPLEALIAGYAMGYAQAERRSGRGPRRPD